MSEVIYELLYFDEMGRLQRIDLSDLKKRRIVLGRDGTQTDVVLSHEMVSRIHGCLYLEKNQVHYQDLHSNNGTKVIEGNRRTNLKSSDRRVLLSNQTFLRIGNQTSFFQFFVRRREKQNGWKSVPIGNKELIIGRASYCDIIFLYPAVSKVHAKIFSKDGVYYIADCKSHNGTKKNARYVEDCEKLNDFDVIQIIDMQIFYCKGMLYYCASVQGVHLTVIDLCKSVGKKRKVLINHVSLEINSNDFIAIVGGSGAGKTTLMNAISGFDRECTGQILFNGQDLRKEFSNLKDMIGYVPQQEIIYENLTLHNMLFYTAKMKMQKDTDKEEIEKRIKEVLQMVELSEHANTYIRKLSGGQKKRASIAVELLADPKLFFLDEPTSGLDPGTEKNLMMMLGRLSKTRDKTTILVTHTTQSLHLCDKVIFMGPGGRLCFFGSVEQAKMFFQTDDLVNIYNVIAQNPKMWEEQFRNCCQKMETDEAHNEGSRKEKRNVSYVRQFSVLVKRYMELMWNDKMRLAILLMQPVIIAFLLNLVADENIYSVFEDTQSMMFSLSCSAIWIGLFNSIQEICKERHILKREYMACLKLPLYTLSKFIVQFILAALQALLLLLVFVLAIGKNPEGIWFDSFFFEMYVTVLLTILAAMAIGLLISSLVKSGDKAMTLAPFVLIIQLLFSGILFVLEGAGKKLSYVTISKWSVEALGSITNLNGLDLRMQADFPGLVHEAKEIYEHTGGHLLTDWGILSMMVLLCLILSGLMLINVKNDSR